MLDAQAIFAALSLFAVMLGVSWIMRRSTSTTLDFYLAGRQVGPFLNACAICGDYFSAASFLGVAGAVYAFGLDGVWFATGFGAGFVVVAIFFAAPLRRAGQFSIPDFLANRFDSQMVRLTAVAIVQLVVLVYLIPQMAGAGLTWEALVGKGLFGMSPYATGILVSVAVIAVHAVSGGMRATTWNQALQFGLLFFAVFLLAAIVTVRGFSFPEAVERASARPLGFPATVSIKELREPDVSGRTLLERSRGAMTPAGYHRVLEQMRAGDRDIAVIVAAENKLHPGEPVRFNQPGARFGLSHQVALIFTLLLGTAGLPHIVNRYFTSTSGGAARTSTVWVLVLAATFYLIAILLGIAARDHLPGSAAAAAEGTTFTDGVVREPEQALLWLAHELGGGPLLALVATAALAAIFSTVAGLLIAAATSWGHDVYEQFIDPSASERRRVLLGQGAVIATATLAAAVGLAIGALPMRPSVALMVTWAFAIAGSAFTPIFLLGVWWTRMTARGAALGMAVGAGVAITGITLDVVASSPDVYSLGGIGAFPTLIAAPSAALVALAVSRASGAAEHPGAVWLRMHGTAAERHQARLARLTKESSRG